VIILKKHLLEKVPISDLCDQYRLHPTVFHRWMKEFFKNAVLAFQKHTDAPSLKLEKKVAKLEGKLAQKNEVLAELMEGHLKLKKSWGDLKALWVPHDIRDAIVDCIGYWSRRTGIDISRFPRWIGIFSSKFYAWKGRYGKVNKHNHWIPSDF
jgi:transposase